MNDYIKREDAREKLCSMCRWEWTAMCSECEHPIDDIPAADVVEVVRCKDCRYSISEDEYELWCNGFCNPARLVGDMDYCSHGAAKV